MVQSNPRKSWSLGLERCSLDGKAILSAYENEPDNRASKVEIGFIVSDETTPLSAGTSKLTFRIPFAMTLLAVRASVNTAPTGSSIVVDINESGASVLSTKLTIDVAELTSETAAVSHVISDSVLADDAEMTVDIDQAGSIVPGSGLKIWLIGKRL